MYLILALVWGILMVVAAVVPAKRFSHFVIHFLGGQVVSRWSWGAANPGRLPEVYLAVVVDEHGDHPLMISYQDGEGMSMCTPLLMTAELPSEYDLSVLLLNCPDEDIQLRCYGPFEHVRWLHRRGVGGA